jgi:hypothetical protein
MSMSLRRLRRTAAALALGLGAAGAAVAQEPAASPLPPAGAAMPAAALATPAAAPPLAATPPPAADYAAILQRLAAVQAELDAQKAMLDALSRSEPEREQPLRLYGFVDTGVQKSFIPSSSLAAAVISSPNTFVLGNVNLYFDARPVEDWGALIEVRLTNLPNGASSSSALGSSLSGGTVVKSNTEVFDPTSASGGWSLIKWGGIVLERAYVEWKGSDRFTLRAGSFLTPFGIWNVDHGTPTTISLMLPQFEATEMFPTHQVGLEALGGFKSDPWDIGYALYLSNGRTPGALSLTEQKTVGGRLTFRNRRLRLTLGFSGYTGRVVDQQEQLQATGAIGVTIAETVAYQESAFGADLSLDAGPLRVRSEFAFRAVRYDQGKHELFLGVPGLYQASRNEWDWYGLAAWQLPFFGLEPFLYGETYHVPTPGFDGVITLSAGLNIHFNPAVQLKTQYEYGMFFEDLGSLRGGAASKGNPHFLTARLVVAF